MKRIYSAAAICAITALAGCAGKTEMPRSTFSVAETNVMDVRANDEMLAQSLHSSVYDEFGALTREPVYQNDRSRYYGQPLNKHVGVYVQAMAQDLISNMEYVTDKTPIGVTHFALIDSALDETNLLGMQLAESFVHEFHKFRVPVIDYKATDYIRVTDTGDFLLSRDFLELKHKVPLEYVLTGTMTKHQGGYLVNARLVGMQTKAVVSSAQKLIPFYVVDALIPSDGQTTDGISLIQGE